MCGGGRSAVRVHVVLVPGIDAFTSAVDFDRRPRRHPPSIVSSSLQLSLQAAMWKPLSRSIVPEALHHTHARAHLRLPLASSPHFRIPLVITGASLLVARCSLLVAERAARVVVRGATRWS